MTMYPFIQILVGRTAEEIVELKEAFTAVHQADLKEHVLSYCKLEETKAFFIAILEVRTDLFFSKIFNKQSSKRTREGRKEGRRTRREG